MTSIFFNRKEVISSFVKDYLQIKIREVIDGLQSTLVPTGLEIWGSDHQRNDIQIISTDAVLKVYEI